MLGRRPCQTPHPKNLKQTLIGAVTGKFHAIPRAEMALSISRRANCPLSTQQRAADNVQPSSKNKGGIAVGWKNNKKEKEITRTIITHHGMLFFMFCHNLGVSVISDVKIFIDELHIE
jgi:hypothetical protein